MRRPVILGTFLLLALLFTHAGESSGTRGDERSIWRLRELTEDAFRQADAQALAATLMDDADMVMPDGTLLKGAAEIAKAHAKYFGQNRGVRIKFTRQSLRFLNPDLAVEDARWEEYGGQPGFATNGFDTAVVIRRDGKWRYHSLRVWIPPLAPEPGKEDQAAEVQAIRKLLVDFSAAHKFNDGSRLAAFYAEDGYFMPPNEPAIRGKPAIAARFQRDLDHFTGELDNHIEGIEVAGRWAFVRGTCTLKLTPKGGGEAIEDHLKFINVLRKRPDGSWAFYGDIFNSNRPSSAAPRSMSSSPDSLAAGMDPSSGKKDSNEVRLGPEREIQAIRKRQEEFLAAHSFKNGTRLGEFYTEDALLIPPDEPMVRGRQAIGEWYQRQFERASPLENPKVTIEEIEVFGNLAFNRGEFILKFKGEPDAEPIIRTLRFITLWRKLPNGSWLFYRDIWNTDSRPEPRP